MKTALLLLVIPALVLGARSIDDDAGAEHAAADRTAVHQAVADYVTAIYEAKPELIELQLAKQDGTWKIVHVIWQSQPD